MAWAALQTTLLSSMAYFQHASNMVSQNATQIVLQVGGVDVMHSTGPAAGTAAGKPSKVADGTPMQVHSGTCVVACSLHHPSQRRCSCNTLRVTPRLQLKLLM